MSFSVPEALVSSLVEDINSAAKSLSNSAFQDDGARRSLAETALKLSRALESPPEYMFRICAQPQVMVATRVAIEGRWFDALGNGDEPKTSSNIAQVTGAEPELIARFMRMLALADIVKEVGPETYEPTPTSKEMTTPLAGDMVRHFYEEAFPVFAKLPEYFTKNRYKVPKDSSETPFHSVFGKPMWEYLRDNPHRGASFDSFMKETQRFRKSWIGAYPSNERLGTGIKNSHDANLFVDVAGSTGHQVKEFKAKHTELPGKRFLQDLPEVIARDGNEISVEGITALPYDFMTPQPIKGEAYYFRNIFHDWDFESSQQILKNQAVAMEKGYSKIIINEHVLPATGVPMIPVYLDLMMMLWFGGKERTRKEWQELLESSGLKISGIWTIDGTDCLIEAELQD